MKRFFAVFVVLSLLSLSLLVVPKMVGAEAQSRPVSNGSKCWVEVGEIISADIFVSDPSCGNRGEKLHDDNENTYSIIGVNQRAYFEFPYGGTIWKQTTMSQVENDVHRYHPSWSRDTTCTVWPRGSSSPSQPDSTNWPSYQWKQLFVNQFLVVQSGSIYWNFTSQNRTSSFVTISRTTTITTTATVWIWTTIAAKLYQNDPNLGYEKVVLSPPTNTDPDEWLYGSIPTGGYATGWLEAYLNGSWIDQKQSCLNGLVTENNSKQTVQIRYKQADPSNPHDRRLVTIYSSGNSLETIKTHYANTLNVPVSHLSVRKLFLNPTSTNPSTLLPN